MFPAFYNGLVAAWSELPRQATAIHKMPGDWQGDLDRLLAQILFNCNVYPVAPRRQMSLKNNGLLIKSKY